MRGLALLLVLPLLLTLLPGRAVGSEQIEEIWSCEFGDVNYLGYDAAKALEISSDGNYLAVGTEDGYLRLFERSGTQLWHYRAEDDLFLISISADGIT